MFLFFFFFKSEQHHPNSFWMPSYFVAGPQNILPAAERCADSYKQGEKGTVQRYKALILVIILRVNVK